MSEKRREGHQEKKQRRYAPEPYFSAARIRGLMAWLRQWLLPDLAPLVLEYFGSGIEGRITGTLPAPAVGLQEALRWGVAATEERVFAHTEKGTVYEWRSDEKQWYVMPIPAGPLLIEAHGHELSWLWEGAGKWEALELEPTRALDESREWKLHNHRGYYTFAICPERPTEIATYDHHQLVQIWDRACGSPTAIHYLAVPEFASWLHMHPVGWVGDYVQMQRSCDRLFLWNMGFSDVFVYCLRTDALIKQWKCSSPKMPQGFCVVGDELFVLGLAKVARYTWDGTWLQHMALPVKKHSSQRVPGAIQCKSICFSGEALWLSQGDQIHCLV